MGLTSLSINYVNKMLLDMRIISKIPLLIFTALFVFSVVINVDHAKEEKKELDLEELRRKQQKVQDESDELREDMMERYEAKKAREAIEGPRDEYEGLTPEQIEAKKLMKKLQEESEREKQ
jgi:choline-glycine betaine transporter